MNNRQENVVVDEGTVGQDFTVIDTCSKIPVDENLLNLKNWERFFIEKIDRELGIPVHTVEVTIQNAVLNAIDSIVNPKIELTVNNNQ